MFLGTFCDESMRSAVAFSVIVRSELELLTRISALGCMVEETQKRSEEVFEAPETSATFCNGTFRGRPRCTPLTLGVDAMAAAAVSALIPVVPMITSRSGRLS